jgi:hypothetical protein
MAAIGGQSRKTQVQRASAGAISNFTLDDADTEYTIVLPASTVLFTVAPRGDGELRLAFAETETEDAYKLIPPGAQYASPEFSPQAFEIFLRSSQAGLIVEIETWS